MLKGSNLRILAQGAEIAREHHEKWDGTGYPSGLRGESISLAARIAALADVYDALSHTRCYKLAWPNEDVLAEIRSGSGTHFDPRVVEAFFRALPRIEAVRRQHPDPC
jgi:response regulator RpfG family c-di-GMP phosphodiesterase